MTCLTLSTVLLFAIQVQAALAQPSTSAASSDRPQSGPVDSAATVSKPADASGDRWRFKQHQGLWWYWLPTNQWVYRVNDRWVPYEPESYAAFLATRRSQDGSSSSGQYQQRGGTQQGNWGAVRYNQFGQPQYPYSQRSSGIRQLGPVPAMGGVRSLPGWGGER